MNRAVDNKIFTGKACVAVLVAGVLIGVAGASLKWLISMVSRWATSGFDVGGGNWWMIPTAVAGIVLTALIVRYIFKVRLDDSTAQINGDITDRRSRLPMRLTVAPIVACAVTLGFGGSAGSEGPTAYSGAAIASNVARVFGFSKKQMMFFLVCGAGAGIAAIFKAPIGGMFFAIELLQLEVGLTFVSMLALMCVAAGLTAYCLGGFVPDLLIGDVAAFSPGMLPLLVGTGVVCGLYSAYYLTTGRYVKRKLQGFENRPILMNVISGLLLGALLFLFPALYGEGYGVVSLLAAGKFQSAVSGSVFASLPIGWAAALALSGILLVKGIASYTTNSGGGVAGDFAPTLFAGGVAGALITFAIVPLLPVWMAVDGPTMVVCSMAAVMAGVIRAPLMAIFLSVEMTGKSELLLPVVITALISYGVSRLVKR